jgi:hypothetical protein
MLKIVSKLFFLSILLVASACAPRYVEIPTYEGMDVREVLAAKKSVSDIEAVFSVTFEKEDTSMKGDGKMDVSRDGDLALRIYSFGFLAFELTSHDGIVHSNPPVDRNKSTMLTYGLRDCLFWWDIDDPDFKEENDAYIFSDVVRKIWIEKKTMLPMKQTVSLSDGRELVITYESPEKMNEIWYPTKIRIQLAQYSVTLVIRELLFVLKA